MKIRDAVVLLVGLVLWVGRVEGALSLLDEKVAPLLAQVVQWAAAPEIVDAVRSQNRQLPVGYSAMTQGAWAKSSPMDEFVVSFTKTRAALFLRAQRNATITEAFLNDAAGYKVAFLSKPTNWRHLGKPKHDEPMTGKIWRGPIEKDQSSGIRQIQVAAPVLDHGTPIGSLVVGLNIFELATE
jgi:hypothetical protein